MSWFKFRNLSEIVNCVTESLIHKIALNLNVNQCFWSHCTYCSHCNHCSHCSHCSLCSNWSHCKHFSHCSLQTLKSKSVTHLMTDWQCDLLSCPGQLKKSKSISFSRLCCFPQPWRCIKSLWGQKLATLIKAEAPSLQIWSQIHSHQLYKYCKTRQGRISYANKFY